MADPEYTRLHITPFNPSLLNAIIPPSIQPNAKNISYHEHQTFPEKAYGYVDLPVMDAEKIKKKLHGSILKGTKVRIEKARPKKEVVIEEEEPEKPKREKKKRKRDELPGVDIGERHVKRGWTVPAKDFAKHKEEKKSVVKSKNTTEPECLFKTVLPPNVASKNPKAGDGKPDKKKVKKGGKEVVVHEFTKTEKFATFLRGPAGSKKSKVAAEFVEGKGWVDEDGNVVEVVKKVRKAKVPEVKIPKAKAPVEESSSSEESADENDGSASEEEVEEAADAMDVDKSLPNPSKATQASSDDGRSSADSSSDEEDVPVTQQTLQTSPTAKEPATEEDSSIDDSSSEEESSEEEAGPSTFPAEKVASLDAPSDSSSSEDSSDSDLDSDSSSDEETQAKEAEIKEPQSATSLRPQSSGGISLSIKIPESLTSTPISSSVHPLEALYKRPQTTDATPKASVPSFSFFGADTEDMDEDTEPGPSMQVPLTPFTQRDFEWRGTRSAAPTPDTAHANKRFIWPRNGDDDDDEDDDDDDDEEEESMLTSQNAGDENGEGKGKEKEGASAETDFQKWFWENRGETNRAWKRRRKTVAKEKRQRDNRKRQDRTA